MNRVVVITTGGTIASAADATGVLRPARTGAELLREIDADVIDLMSVDSSQMTLPDWDRITAAIQQANDSQANGIVITHGTDSLEEIALWLDLTYNGSAPVVLTAATRSADSAASDGPANLRSSIAVADSSAARDLGVLVCVEGSVLEPLGTSKVGGQKGFVGTAVGSVSDGRFQVTREKQRPFLGAASAATAPRVDVVACYLGADSVAIDAVVAAGARGVVLAALGAGNAGGPVIDAVRRHCNEGVEVAVSTRVPFDAAGSSYGPGRELAEAGAVMVPRLRPAQARVLLMAALATNSSVADVLARWG